MKETVFEYKPRFRITSLGYGVLAPLFLIVFPIVYPFSIGIGGITLVPYPWTILLFLLAAAGFFWSFYGKLNRYMKLKSYDCNILVTDRIVSFKDVVKGKATDVSFNLDDVTRVKMDDEEGELEVTVTDPDGNISYLTFDMRYFSSQQDFDDFTELLKS